MRALAIDLGSALLVLGALIAAVLVAGRYLPGDRGGDDFWASLARIVRAVDMDMIALTLACTIALLAVLGALVVVGDVPLEPFRINAEQTVPAAVSALLLFASAAVALLARRQGAKPAWSWLILGLGLIVLGFDEMAELHERIEARTGLSSGVVLGPVAVAMLVAWLAALPELRRLHPAVPLFVIGAAVGALSQSLDPIHSPWKSVAEETLELGSGALFLLATLTVARRAGHPPPMAVRDEAITPAL